MKEVTMCRSVRVMMTTGNLSLTVPFVVAAVVVVAVTGDAAGAFV